VTTVSIAAGTLVFALGTAILCGAATLAGRGFSESLTTALGAVELAIVSLVVVHVIGLLDENGGVDAKQIAYFTAGVLLLPVLVLGSGPGSRSRAPAAAIGCMAVAVLALRIQVVA